MRKWWSLLPVGNWLTRIVNRRPTRLEFSGGYAELPLMKPLPAGQQSGLSRYKWRHGISLCRSGSRSGDPNFVHIDIFLTQLSQIFPDVVCAAVNQLPRQNLNCIASWFLSQGSNSLPVVLSTFGTLRIRVRCVALRYLNKELRVGRLCQLRSI